MNRQASGGLASEGALIPAVPSAFRDGMGLWWLGQAGFLIETASTRIVVDPYLSDRLARLFGYVPLSHRRMMRPPVEAEALLGIDVVLVTHDHGDHLDPDSLLPIARNNPGCRFVVPASAVAAARVAGLPEAAIQPIEAFQSIELGALRVSAIPAAHEELAIDDHGRALFLGYVFEVDGNCIYHSGDCAPYPGLLDNLAPFRIDLGLLPVNGRDEWRRSQNILGNFDLGEAMDLARRASFGASLGHHFGLFDFNTIDEDEGRESLSTEGGGRFDLVRPGMRYSLR
ncbi:MAG TPA: MBL fold metallo-hydrolase [Rectinemataceae bacterium]|nr:MBL fold metallo-hydrolase [Rectinemataceae bacterium]